MDKELTGKVSKTVCISLFLSVLVLLTLGLIIWPAVRVVISLGNRLICGTNLVGVGVAVSVYSDDYDGRVPECDNWNDILIAECDVLRKQFQCNYMEGEGSSYALNANAAGKELESLPADMVLVYESIPGWNRCGGPELLNIENHGEEGCHVIFCDRSVLFVKTEELDSLIWSEEQAAEADDAEDVKVTQE